MKQRPDLLDKSPARYANTTINVDETRYEILQTTWHCRPPELARLPLTQFEQGDHLNVSS